MTKVRLLTAALLLLVNMAAAAAEDTEWTQTLERISSGVVSIRVDSTRAFDTEWNSSSQATGFVVDAERGIILTNASGTSGGSSGSPVVNIDGDVIALNAGANNSAASSFFLPLDRIDRALQEVRAGNPVTRGTLQTTFQSKPFDELRRLGLTSESERLARSRNAAQTSMLTVGQVIPGSPAAGKLAPGDILIRINGEMVTEFVPLEAVLDSHVGSEIEVEIERGGQRMVGKIIVDDLHAITPDEYIEFGDGIVNKLSYQQARHYNRQPTGVYVANPGYLFSKVAIPRGAVIIEMDGKPIDDLDDFEAALDQLADGERAKVRYVNMENPQNSVVRLLEMDRVWFPAQRCARDDSDGTWPCRTLADGPEPEPAKVGSTRLKSYDDPRLKKIAPSLVVVTFSLPYTLSGVTERHYYGTGLIVDKERGYVVVDRNTVPIAIGDVTITFAGSLEVDGKIEQLHPLHNFAIVSYDPKSIGETPVKAAEFNTRSVMLSTVRFPPSTPWCCRCREHCAFGIRTLKALIS